MQPDVLGSFFLLSEEVQSGSMLSSPIVSRVALSFGIAVSGRRPSPKNLVDRLFRPRLVLFQGLSVGSVFVCFHRREEELVVAHMLGKDKDGTHSGVSREIERHGSVQLLRLRVLAPVESRSYVFDESRSCIILRGQQGMTALLSNFGTHWEVQEEVEGLRALEVCFPSLDPFLGLANPRRKPTTTESTMLAAMQSDVVAIHSPLSKSVLTNQPRCSFLFLFSNLFNSAPAKCLTLFKPVPSFFSTV